MHFPYTSPHLVHDDGKAALLEPIDRVAEHLVRVRVMVRVRFRVWVWVRVRARARARVRVRVRVRVSTALRSASLSSPISPYISLYLPRSP